MAQQLMVQQVLCRISRSVAQRQLRRPVLMLLPLLLLGLCRLLAVNQRLAFLRPWRRSGSAPVRPAGLLQIQAQHLCACMQGWQLITTVERRCNARSSGGAAATAAAAAVSDMARCSPGAFQNAPTCSG